MRCLRAHKMISLETALEQYVQHWMCTICMKKCRGRPGIVTSSGTAFHKAHFASRWVADACGDAQAPARAAGCSAQPQNPQSAGVHRPGSPWRRGLWRRHQLRQCLRCDHLGGERSHSALGLPAILPRHPESEGPILPPQSSSRPRSHLSPSNSEQFVYTVFCSLLCKRSVRSSVT